MKEIRFIFGTIYVEGTDNKKKVKILDSYKKELCDLYIVGSMEDFVTSLKKRSKYTFSLKKFLNKYDVGYEIVSRNWNKIARSLEYTFRHENEKINSVEEVMNHAWTNKIGKYYIQVI